MVEDFQHTIMYLFIVNQVGQLHSSHCSDNEMIAYESFGVYPNDFYYCVLDSAWISFRDYQVICNPHHLSSCGTGNGIILPSIQHLLSTMKRELFSGSGNLGLLSRCQNSSPDTSTLFKRRFCEMIDKIQSFACPLKQKIEKQEE